MQKAGANLFMKLPFLLFPLALSVFSLNEQLTKRIQYLFVAGCAMAVFLSFRFLCSSDCADADWKQYAQYEEYFILHRPYFGVYLLLAICILYNDLKRKFNALAIILMVVFIAFIVLIQAKMSIITLFILFVAEARLINNQKIRKAVILTLSAGIATAMLAFSLYYLNQRSKLHQKHGNERFLILSVNTRLEHYTCAIEIIKENIFLGVGSGNLAPMLDSCYNRHNTQLTKNGRHFNVHNEFLEETARHGFIGLSVYIACFFFFFRQALRKKDHRYLQLLLIIVLASMTETIFSRAQGVLIFSFFNALFYLREDKTLSDQIS
jgi:O-antigen ligase